MLDVVDSNLPLLFVSSSLIQFHSVCKGVVCDSIDPMVKNFAFPVILPKTVGKFLTPYFLHH